MLDIFKVMLFMCKEWWKVVIVGLGGVGKI